MPRPPKPTAAIDVSDRSRTGPLDDLQQRIAFQRALLVAWQEAREAAWVRYARDIAPLHDTYCALLAQQVHRLDVASASPGLSKADRAAMRALIAEWAGMLASASRAQAERAAMQDIQRRHAEAAAPSVPPPCDDIEPQGDAVVQATVADGSEEDWETDWENARAAAERDRAAHHAARRSRTRADKTTPATPSLREVYRRVASALHPDRETDAAARDRKTILMQQANRAYAAQDLLGLLELLNGGAQQAAALAPYQALLTTQLDMLQREVAGAIQAFCEEFGVDAGPRLNPDKAQASLRAQAQQLRDAIAWQRAALSALPEDAEGVRRWLREERAARRRWGD